MTDAERERFDALLEAVIDALPEPVHRVIDEVPLIVLDEPTPVLLTELGIDPSDADAAHELCGLHTGVPDTERSVEESGVLPPDIHLFRRGIVFTAGGWRQPGADDRVAEEIRITILHEVGHQFGLDEDELADLGYE
jgi:predicted Zn-dependent protease with MMP-like domain